MQVLVFVTEGDDGNPTGPTLFVADRPDAVLPANPRSLDWRYFATIGVEDDLLAHVPGAIEMVKERGYCIANMLI